MNIKMKTFKTMILININKKKFKKLKKKFLKSPILMNFEPKK